MSKFELRGYKLVGCKMVKPTLEHFQEHYVHLKDRPFFPKLVEFMSSSPVVAMVWEGKDVVKQGRKMLGETDPLQSLPGSLRGDYSIDMGRNLVHGSDSVETANKEIAMWFKPHELFDWDMTISPMIYE